jgi:hypothetical protein
MTKKDYRKIADILKKNKPICNCQMDQYEFQEFEKTYFQWYSILQDFIDLLEKDNPNFSKSKFQEYIHKS